MKLEIRTPRRERDFPLRKGEPQEEREREIVLDSFSVWAHEARALRLGNQEQLSGVFVCR